MAKRKIPNIIPIDIGYHVKALQQGGVFTNPAQYDVGLVQGVTSPHIPMPTKVDIPDASAEAYRQNTLELRREAQANKEEQQKAKELAGVQSDFLQLQDKLLGPIDNPYQEAKYASLKKAHGIPENITSDIFNNPYQLKDMEFKVSQLIQDPEYQKVAKQLATVKKMRESAEIRLKNDPENQGSWAKWAEAYDKYSFSEVPFNEEVLAPANYIQEKAPKETDYASWLDSSANRDYLAGIDPKSQPSLDQYYDDLAGEFVAKGAKEAIDRGYIEYIDPTNHDYGVTLTDKGKDLALDKAEKAKFIKAGRYGEYVKKRRLGQQLTQENTVFSDKIRDQNVADKAAEEKKNPGGGSSNESDNKAQLRIEKERLQARYPGIDFSQTMPDGVSIGDNLRDGLIKHDLPAAKQKIEAFLKAGGKDPNAPAPVPDIFGGTGLSPAEQAMKPK